MTNDINIFDNADSFHEHMDGLFGQIGDRLTKILTEAAVNKTDSPNAALHFPVAVSPRLWTQMVWDNIVGVLKSGNAEAIQFIRGELAEAHPGVVEKLWVTGRESVVELNNTLWPVPYDGCFVDYYLRFDGEPGFEKFVTAVETAGLNFSLYTVPNDDGNIEFGVSISTSDGKPLSLYMKFMQDGVTAGMSSNPS